MRPAAALLLIGLLFLPLASAQAPAPATRVTVRLPAGPVTIELGAQHEIPFSVTFTAANFACTQAAAVTLPLTVAGTPSELPTVMAHASPPNVDFTIPAGIYQDTATAGNGPYNKTVEGKFIIMVAPDAPPNHQHAFTLSASFTGGTPSGCAASSDLPKAMGSAKHQLVTGSRASSGSTTMPGMSSGEHSTMNPQTTSPTPTPVPTVTKSTPNAPILAIVGIAVLVAILRRDSA